MASVLIRKFCVSPEAISKHSSNLIKSLRQMENLLTLTHATERDIDLLLVEELKCSPNFVRWFVSKVQRGIHALPEFAASNVVHSKRRTHNRREIDICLKLTPTEGLPIYVLIENKLDTSEQVLQAELYRAEATFSSKRVKQRLLSPFLSARHSMQSRTEPSLKSLVQFSYMRTFRATWPKEVRVWMEN